MKNLKKSLIRPLLLLFAVSLMVSCSKDEDTQPKVIDKDFRVTIEYTGDIQHYVGYLTVNGTIDSDQKGVTVSGVDFDKDYSVGETTIYEKTFEPITGTFSIKTDKKAALMQFGYSVWYTSAPNVQHTPVVVTVKYYVNDALVKTETFKASEGITGDPYLGKLDASEY